jgi:ribosome-binding protein aMBF1 (putative translation factor)
MDEAKRKQLESHGWKVGDVQEFIGLRNDEKAYIDLCGTLTGAARSWRERAGLTQHALAERLGSARTLVARMESGHPSASVDMMVRALLASGATLADVAAVIAPERARAA